MLRGDRRKGQQLRTAPGSGDETQKVGFSRGRLLATRTTQAYRDIS